MTTKRSYLLLFFFFFIVAGVAIIGVEFQPGSWYAGLQKPSWTPPNWLFPIAWTVLYLMIAVSGWLIFSDSDIKLQLLWVVQLIFNGLWSWIFFGKHLVLVGLLDISLMFLSIAALFFYSLKTLRIVAWLTFPYLLWVGYATSLNAGIYWLNP